MNKIDLLRKMEEYVGAYRQQLDKYEGYSLSMLSNQAKNGIKALKKAVKNNEQADKALESLHEYMDKFEQAVKSGDRKVSTKAVEMMEKILRNLKTKAGKDDCKDHS